MKTSARKDFEVYDFKDEGVELISSKILEKFGRSKTNYQEEFGFPKEDCSPTTKYHFLKAFSSGTRSQGKKMNSISCPNAEPSDCNYSCEDHGPHTSTSNQEGCASEVETWKSEDIPVSNNLSRQEDAHTNPDAVVSGNPIYGYLSGSSFATPHGNENSIAKQAQYLGLLPSGNGPKNNLVGVHSDDDVNTTCSVDMEDQGSFDDSASDRCSSGPETDTTMAVVQPDYLIHKDLYSTESSLCFSCSCIKLEGVNAYGSKGNFSFEWDIVDVMDIDCLWCARVETALVKLCIRSAADSKTEAPDGPSGITELKFAVYDPRWFDIQEDIMKVDGRYKSIWRVLSDPDANEEDNLVGRKSYFPEFDEHFEDVIYPKGDPDAVSISRRDVELLQPETFINDTIIDFYIKYLMNNIKHEDRNKFHFFNSFFFRKLADLDKNPSSASDGRAAFLRVRKWTRKVNLFEKNYIFIPINFSLHWSLIVICHPGEIPTLKDEEVDKALRVPCILHMDSIKGSHKGLKNLVQSYLLEEWKERQGEASDNVSSNFLNLRFVSLEVPQQENSFDCGLFLLHYVERFLEEAPAHFNPFKLSKYSYFLNSDWFPPAEASLKRASIQRLICELLKSYQKIPSANPDMQCQSSQSMKNNCGKEDSIEFLVDDHVAVNSSNGLGPNDDKGIEIELLGTPVAPQFAKDSTLVLKDLFEQGETVEAFSEGKLQSVDHSLFSLKENEERDESLALTTGDISCYRHLSENTDGDGCTASYSSKDNGVYHASLGPNEDHVDFSSNEVSCCDSDSFSEEIVGENRVTSFWNLCRSEINEMAKAISLEKNLCTTESSASGCKEQLDAHIVEDSEEMDRVSDDNEKRSSPGCKEELDTQIVEDSQETDRVYDNEKKGSPSCQENSAASLDHFQVDLDENEIHLGEKQELSEDMSSTEPFQQRASKRAKLKLPPIEERQFAES